MQPKPAFDPPTHTPVSQLLLGQSASEQQLALLPVHRPVSLTQMPPGQESGATVPQPPLPVQFPPSLDPPEHRIGMRSASRKIAEVSGRFRPVTLPAAQSALPVAFAVSVLITHVLVAAPLCEVLGMGSGGPKRQPAFVQLVLAHVALLQLPPEHVPPRVQSALVLHGEAQSLLARHDAPRFDGTPAVQCLPPASAGVAPVSVTVVPTHDAAMTDVPRAGMITGSGTPTPAPPK
ncbi:MAG: hypothetical protein DMD33_20245 [Gemmatimonadetes bacterium]|nr:MAG: hypothetical protein DMD33_20245 [Gemmatimonadota bacterium]